MTLSFAHTIEQLENDELIPQTDNVVFSQNLFTPDGLDEPESHYYVSGNPDEFDVTLNVVGESFTYHIILHRIPLPELPTWEFNGVTVSPTSFTYLQEYSNPYRIVDVKPIELPINQPLTVRNSFGVPFDWGVRMTSSFDEGTADSGVFVLNGYTNVVAFNAFALRNGSQTWPILVNNAS